MAEHSRKVKSAIPRFFIAAIKSGCFLTSFSMALSSSRSQFGWTPSSLVQETSRSLRRPSRPQVLFDRDTGAHGHRHDGYRLCARLQRDGIWGGILLTVG